MPKFLSIPEVCEACRISKPTLWRTLKRGDGPAVYRIGNKVLIAQEDLTAWLAAKRQSDYQPRAA